MIDLEKFEKLAEIAKSGLPGDRMMFAVHAIDPEGMLDLITEVRRLRDVELMVLDFAAALISSDRTRMGTASLHMTDYAWDQAHPKEGV
jgi:hypothetical protein